MKFAVLRYDCSKNGLFQGGPPNSFSFTKIRLKTSPFPILPINLLRVLSIQFAALTTASALDFNWDNSAADNDYSNPSNWEGNVAPTAGSSNYVVIDRAGSDKAIFSGGTGPNLAGLRIGYNGTDGELHQTGGTLNFTANTGGATRIGRNGEVGTYLMTGGTATINAVQLGLGSSGAGNITISGGDMTISRGAGTGSSSLIVDFGSGSTEGNFEISGGSLETRTDVIIGNNGTFSVLGSDATSINIGTLSSLDGQWTQEAGGTLRGRIADTPAGITKIFIDDKGDAGDGDGNVTFGEGALLDIGFLDASVEGEWDLMSWEGILTDNGLTLAPGVDPSIWSFDFIDTNSSGTPDTLRVKTSSIVESAEYTYDANAGNVNMSSVSGAYSDDASATDAINDGNPTFASEVQTTGVNFGPTGLNDGTALGTGNVLNTYYDNIKFPATVTFALDTTLVPTGYDITGITTIAGWEKNGANLANQVYEVWISAVGDPNFYLLHTVDYKPFTSTGLNGNTASTKVNLASSGGILANGVDEIRFIFLDDGENFALVDGTVYQEIDIFSSTTPPPVLVMSEMFSDSMVLQRDVDVPIWGAAPANAEVTVALDSVVVATTTADSSGDWMAQLGPYPGDGGQPHTLTVSTPGEADVVLTDVVFGDVYIASGQSNMARSLTGIGASSEITVANFPLIRQIKMAEVTSSSEQDEPTVQYDWTVCSPPVAGNFCAVAYFFAKELQAVTGEPVGILFSAWGGRTIERFINPQGLEAVPALSGVLQNREDGNISQYSDIYNAMIAPMSPYAVRGALWYQGEQNASAGDGDIYQLKMRALIRGWRDQWGQQDFSFYWVQLPNFITAADWPPLRDSQLKALSEPDTGMAIIIDAGNNNDIHPTNKKDPGERLASLALAAEYEQSNISSGPLLYTSTIEGSQVRVHFDHVGSGLLVGTKSGTNAVVETTGALQNFEIAGADKVFVSATALIDGATVLVSSPSAPSPLYVRYCYSNAPTGGNKLYNHALLPASPFRTDVDYELEVYAGTGDATGMLAGETRTIVADSPPSGMVFDRWIGAASALANPNATSTTVTMPDHDLYLLASYRASSATSYLVTVNNGFGDGTSQSDSLINIEAQAPAAGLIFDYWSGDTATIVNMNAPVTTLRMPSAYVSITAVFKSLSTVGDGIPDSWRALHFGGDGTTTTVLSTAGADPDQDGQNNLAEYNAGTDPNDSNSVFKLTHFEVNAEEITIDFTTQAFNRYLLQSNVSLAPESWSPESYELIGDGLPIQFELVPGAEPRKFFRIRSTSNTPSPPDGLNIP
ncbi:MAG: sialate O-acetylesterase [Roseibacillus sp.]